MSTLTKKCDDHEHLLKEWDELDAVIHHSEQLLERLRLRMGEIEASMDEVTRPSVDAVGPWAPVRGTIALPRRAHAVAAKKPTFIPRGFEYRGTENRANDKIDIYKGVLGRLLEEYPDRSEDIQRKLHAIGRTRNYLSHDRFNLFTGKTDEWVIKYSEKLTDGWYIDTNLGEQTMRRILQAAVGVVGLKWDEDVIVRWRPRWERPALDQAVSTAKAD